MRAMIAPPTIEELRQATLEAPMKPNRKLNCDELATRYFIVCREARDLYERWLITESDEVFREWQFKAKQAQQLKVTIGNRIAN